MSAPRPVLFTGVAVVIALVLAVDAVLETFPAHRPSLLTPDRSTSS